MNISTTAPQISRQQQTPKPQPEKSITEKIVDGTVDSTLAATDRVSGAISGLATGTAAYISAMPGLAADTVGSAGNLFMAKKIGPNIKVVAGLATPLIAGVAVAGAGLGLVIAAGAGLVNGFTAHDSDKPREFTIGQAVSNAWNGTRETVGDFGDGMVEGSGKIRAIEVKPGDDLWDIPLPPFVRTAKTLIATTVGVAAGAIGGLATAMTTTATTAWDGIAHAFTNPSAANVLGAVGAIVAAPVTGTVHGLSKVITSPIAGAAAAWKHDSLDAGLRASGDECFDMKPSALASAAGGFVGGAAVAVPAAAATGLATTAVELGRGLASVTDSNLNIPAKALAVVGGIVSAPAAGIAHGITTGVGTPFVSAAKAGKDRSVKGIGAGIAASHKETKALANGAGALVGGVAVSAVTTTAATASSAVREIGGGLVEAVTNDDLNFGGKLLDAVGGIPGDVMSPVIQGASNLLATPLVGASAAFEAGKASEGAKRSADFGVKSVQAAINPQVMVETVEA